MSGPILGDLSNNRFSGGSLWLLKLSSRSIMQPVEVGVWNFWRHSACYFEVISWISLRLQRTNPGILDIFERRSQDLSIGTKIFLLTFWKVFRLHVHSPKQEMLLFEFLYLKDSLVSRLLFESRNFGSSFSCFSSSRCREEDQRRRRGWRVARDRRQGHWGRPARSDGQDRRGERPLSVDGKVCRVLRGQAEPALHRLLPYVRQPEGGRGGQVCRELTLAM